VTYDYLCKHLYTRETGTLGWQAGESPVVGLCVVCPALRHARQHIRKDGSLGLDPQQAVWDAEDLAARYPVGYFGPEHGLTPAQAWEAHRRLAQADQERPMRGRMPSGAAGCGSAAFSPA
jgi:hypothetical protein